MQTNLFDLNPDLNTLIENIQIGPQAEVLELIEDFNDLYIRGENHINRHYNLQAPTKALGITKKFYWKPGAYDTIKQILWYQGEMHKKAASLYKVVERVKHGTFRYRNMMTSIDNIEDKLNSFRSQGLVMQDNTDDIVEAWNILYNHIMDQHEKSEHGFIINLIPVTDRHETLVNYHLDITYTYMDIKMIYNHVEGDKIAEIMIPGDGHITIRFSLNKLLTTILMAKNMDINNIPANNVIYARHNSKRWLFNVGGNWDSYANIQHPYISRHWNSWGSNTHNYNDDFKYVCVGNMEQEIKACIKSLDFISLKIFIDRIMTHYDTQTSPLNRLSETFHGIPNDLNENEEFWAIIGERSASHCNYKNELLDCHEDGMDVTEDSYCTEVKCVLKNSCSAWQRVVKPRIELTPEQLQQKTLEEATLNLVNNRRRQ